MIKYEVNETIRKAAKKTQGEIAMELPYQIDLSGKVAVVTGGSGVLCSAMAWALAKNGAKVALIGRSREKLAKLVDSMRAEGLDVSGYSCSVTDMAQLKETHQLIHKELGACDILINGAGGNRPDAMTKISRMGKDVGALDNSFWEMTEEGIRDVMDLNYLGTLFPIQVFSEDMKQKRSGSIINIASASSFLPLSKLVIYSNAKCAIKNLTQWLAVHFGQSGIRCNAIAPGFFAAEQNHDLLYKEDGTLTERAGDIIAGTPMGRFGTAQDLLGATLFLASEEASRFVTGIVLPVDGGFTANSGV